MLPIGRTSHFLINFKNVVRIYETPWFWSMRRLCPSLEKGNIVIASCYIWFLIPSRHVCRRILRGDGLHVTPNPSIICTLRGKSSGIHLCAWITSTARFTKCGVISRHISTRVFSIFWGVDLSHVCHDDCFYRLTSLPLALPQEVQLLLFSYSVFS